MYHYQRKEGQVSNLKSFLPEETPKQKSAKDISLYGLFDFLKEFSELQKLHLPLKDSWADIFD